MMQQVNVMKVNGYIQKYGVDGIGKGADKWMIKRQMLENLRKEIFELSVFRIGPQVFSNEYDPSEKDRKKLENILAGAQKKWNAICKIFNKYEGTSGLIEEKDLIEYLDEQMNPNDIHREETENEKEEESNGSDEAE